MRPRVLVPYRQVKRVKPYLEALRAVGIDAYGHSVEKEGTLEGMAGLVLMGGTDVDPARYGESAAAETDAPDEERDEFEFDITAEALDRDLPVLAICRGMQLLNVALKGTLIQHLGSARHDPKFNDRAKPAHEVDVRPDSLLAKCTGKIRLQVNSRHHQAVSKIGEGLQVCGRDPETGMVEALECESKRFVLAVQWHPEDQVATDPVQKRMFQSFADALLLP